MTTAFRAETEALDDLNIVSLVGELDQATVPELQQALEAAIASDSRALLVDLSDCSFIDSSGLGALVSGRERLLATDGWRFGICCPGEQVARLLAITGLDQAMGLLTTRQEALEALRSQG